jgi:hypothetical protein
MITVDASPNSNTSSTPPSPPSSSSVNSLKSLVGRKRYRTRSPKHPISTVNTDKKYAVPVLAAPKLVVLKEEHVRLSDPEAFMKGYPLKRTQSRDSGYQSCSV